MRAAAGQVPEHGQWRPELRRKLMVLLAIKVIALALLWALFFSPQHRAKVEGPVLDQRFSLDPDDPRSGASP